MKFEVKRKVMKEVEEAVSMELMPYWVIRVVKVGGFNNKEVIHEVEYHYEPDEEEIADALVDYMNQKVFAGVVKNYRLVEEQK